MLTIDEYKNISIVSQDDPSQTVDPEEVLDEADIYKIFVTSDTFYTVTCKTRKDVRKLLVKLTAMGATKFRIVSYVEAESIEVSTKMVWPEHHSLPDENPL